MDIVLSLVPCLSGMFGCDSRLVRVCDLNGRSNKDRQRRHRAGSRPSAKIALTRSVDQNLTIVVVKSCGERQWFVINDQGLSNPRRRGLPQFRQRLRHPAQRRASGHEKRYSM